MGTQNKSISKTQLAVLFWLRLVDNFEMEEAETLGEKYFCFSPDEIGLYQSELDDTVTELCTLGLMEEKQGDKYELKFTATGEKLADAMISLDKARATGFKAIKEIKQFLIEHENDIKEILKIIAPYIISILAD